MITSSSNPKVKRIVQWQNKAKERRSDGIFLVEGFKMFEEAPEGWIREVYLADGAWEKACAVLERREKLIRIGFETVSRELFGKMSDTRTPQGILCVLERPHYSLEELLTVSEPLFMVLENLQDPGNLGGRAVKPGTVIALAGDLGVGKTVFTQGVAAGLGIPEPVNSPTFTILQIYDGGRLPFYHFDVYRICDVEEMEEIGYEDCFYGDGVCLVEWADLIRELLPENHCRICIEKDPEKDFDYRKIVIEGWEVQDAESM